jgi:putative DNA primase/helicase
MTALRSMAAALGGEVMKGRDGSFILCPGPGHSPADRSLSVSPSSTDQDGFVCYSHARDDWRLCREHILARTGRRAAFQPRVRTSPSPASAGSHNGASAKRLWNEATGARRTLVERYLNESRSLELPDDVDGRVVRFHETCAWGNDRRPCMLTAFRSIADDKLVAVHRTLLSDDGRKLDRRMLGPVGGAAIKIDDNTDVEQGLSICEGFETGLAGRELGFRPVWALGSATAIGTFPLLAGIDALTVLAETDDSGANARAARSCGNRWASADREVIVATPRISGDMNDVVRA